MAEGYTPTVEERKNALEKSDLLKLSGDGIFATLQGEGVTAGEPAVFIRLQDCNLHCGANDQGWRCDAWYTWDKTTQEYWREATNVSATRVAEQVSQAWNNKFTVTNAEPRLVITGGEPLLQQRKLPALLNLLPDWKVEVETNGTIPPNESLETAQINCSPKLASSGNNIHARYRSRVLRRINSMPNSWFKFVITDFEADPQEVESIIESIAIDPQRVLLMGEGTNARALVENQERISALAKAIGCGVTLRNHIFWYGDKRAT